jgi:hypothetical protein
VTYRVISFSLDLGSDRSFVVSNQHWGLLCPINGLRVRGVGGPRSNQEWIFGCQKTLRTVGQLALTSFSHPIPSNHHPKLYST